MKPKELTDLETLARASIIVSENDDWYGAYTFTENGTVDNDLDARFIEAASPRDVLELIEQAKQANAKPQKAK